MRKIMSMCLFTLMLFFLAGCSKSDSGEDPDKDYVYYINNAETKVVYQEYKVKETQEVKIVTDIIAALQKDPEDLSNKKTIPDNVNLPTVDFLGNGKIRLNFDSTYNQMTGIQELLRRAAIVKTLCQFSFVNSVEFYVEDNPLTDADGQQVGAMTNASFIESFNYVERQNIVLYYANADRTLLKGVEAVANYDGSSTLERIVIDQLIKGTDGIENLEQYYGTIHSTIPSGTECNSINTVDYACYVDLNSRFLEESKEISDEMVIYSIVNSLTSLSTINKVKFTIDGESVSTFGTIKNFDQYFEMNYNLIEKTSQSTSNSETEAP